MPQPVELPKWAADNAGVPTAGAQVDPPGAKKTAGWAVAEKPPAQFMNWIFGTIYQWIIYLKNITSEALTWTGHQIFQNGIELQIGNLDIGGNEIISEYVPLTWAEEKKCTVNGKIVRMFEGTNKWSKTINAQWNDSTSKWSSDDHAQDSVMQTYDNSGTVQWLFKAANAGTWDDGFGIGAWGFRQAFDNAGNAIISGNVICTLLGAGTDVDAGSDVNAGNNVTAGNDLSVGNNATVTGDITSTTGDILSQAGAVTAHTDLTAVTGDVKSAGGYLIGPRLSSFGGNAPMITPVSIGGAGAGVSLSANSTDMAGKISVTWGAAPTGGRILRVSISFSSAYPAVPRSVLLTNSSITAGNKNITVENLTANGFDLVAGPGVAGDVDIYYYSVIG